MREEIEERELVVGCRAGETAFFLGLGAEVGGMCTPPSVCAWRGPLDLLRDYVTPMRH